MWNRILLMTVGCLSLSGCVIVQVGVTNLMPELTSVAVVPFFNQLSESSINGRRVGEAYASELQKIPGVEVIPIGVVETAMREQGLMQIPGPEDAIKLAKLLDADAIVIGSITECKPYYPPRLGLSVAWYTPHQVGQPANMPIDPLQKQALKDSLKERHGLGVRRGSKRYWNRYMRDASGVVDGFLLDDLVPSGAGPFQYESKSTSHPVPMGAHLENSSPNGPVIPTPEPQAILPTKKQSSVIRGQSPNTSAAQPEYWPPANPLQYRQPEQIPTYRRATNLPTRQSVRPPRLLGNVIARQILPNTAPRRRTRYSQTGPIRRTAGDVEQPAPAPRPLVAVSPQPLPTGKSSQVRRTVRLTPIMSYTRVFDTSDADLVAIWRDDLETTGDQRSGDWEARLFWSENFIRFSTKLMIVEMFQLHGGEAKRRIIFKPRKYK